MNKRKEPITARAQKKDNKEVRKAMKSGDTIVPKVVKAVKPKAPIKAKVHKKISKRTAPKEKIVGSTPAHVHTENEHWSQSVSKKNLLQAGRLRKKMTKKPVSKGR